MRDARRVAMLSGIAEGLKLIEGDNAVWNKMWRRRPLTDEEWAMIRASAPPRNPIFDAVVGKAKDA